MEYTDNTILVASNLQIGFPGREKKPVYHPVSMEARKGEIISVLGKNGIGKSTLLRTLARLQKPLDGKILIRNRKIEQYGRIELARTIGFVSTEVVRISNLSVFDLVSLGRFPHTNWMGQLRDHDLKLVEDSVSRVGLANLMHKNVNEISDGERQRAMIARTLAQDTDIVILDEPTAFLDFPNKYEVIHLLSELSREKGKTIVFSTHDLHTAIQETDRIWLMLPEGLVTGAPEDLILDRSFHHIFGDSRLHFDSEKGEFRIRKNVSREIGITGKGEALFWTQRALERLGYGISAGESAETIISIEYHEGKLEWVFQENQEIRKFGSIYDLSLHLRQ